MKKASMMRIGLVLAAWAWGGPREAEAQFAPPPPASTPTMSPMAVMGNPYLNPYMNPSLYPGTRQQPLSGTNALLFMYAAQSANGGIGSGRISGTRPDPAAAPARRARAAEMPISSMSPGGGAARYFNPTPARAAGAGRYYNQRGRYFMNNGR